MRWILVLVTLLGLAVHPAMAVPPVEKGAKELPPGQKPSQETPVMAKPPEGAMVVVPAGEFMMGSAAGDSDEQPEHKIYVDSFSMDVYEVTVGQYAAFLQAKGIDPPADWKTMNQSANQKRPIANVDSTEASFYCKWVGKRLPTEAEWEKAARGTDGRLYPWGNDPPTPLHANFGKTDWNNHAVLAPVGSFEAGSHRTRTRRRSPRTHSCRAAAGRPRRIATPSWPATAAKCSRIGRRSRTQCRS